MSTAGVGMRERGVTSPALETTRAESTEQPGLRATRFHLAGDDYFVVSFPNDGGSAPSALTTAERAVFRAMLNGQSNKEIAARRGRAERTIANQIAAIFQKLGVGSRAELVAKYNGRR